MADLRNKKIFFWGTVCIIAFVVVLISFKTQSEGIALGSITVSEDDRPAQWQNIIAKEFNIDRIKLIVDNKEIQLNKADILIDENKNIMIPAYIFPDTFNCAFNAFDDTSVTLQKGNIIAILDTNNSYITVDGQSITMDKALVKKNDMTYINALVLKEAFGYQYNWSVTDNKLEMINNKKSENILPHRYSYRDTKRMLCIKNQGNTSSCWAFASLTALETSIMPAQNTELSVNNMVCNNGYVNTLNDGGDYTRAIAYLTAWRGPVSEADDIYCDSIYNVPSNPVKHIQEVQIIESKNLEEIKKAVFLHGGVESSLYTSMNEHDRSSIYYNNETYAYCYNGTKKPNHDIVIIGWDDNYPKSNFSVDTEADGAFICMNSWGSEFGDEGFFYVSYYDTNIGVHNVVYTGIEDVNNYDNIYQSDICGWVGQLGYESDTAFFSNVYTASENETLQAVGFYATDKNTSYDIYVVENFSDVSSFEQIKYIQSGEFKNAGYYTVNLKQEIDMEAGKKYAVVIKIKTPDAVHPIAIEYAAGKATKNVILDDGEGYISYTGNSWEHVEESKGCNICLKMYTKNM